MRIKGPLFLSAFAILIAILVFGWWIISRPLPIIATPPIDEARDRATGDDAMWDRDLYKTLDEVRIDSVSPEANEVYRLILLPTFHLPIVVRVAKSGERIQLTTKVLDGMGGYEMGKIALEETRELSREDYERFRAALDEAEFWGLPVRDPSDEVVNDGALWIVEARDEGAIRSISRITPKPKVLELCRLFLRLAGREDYYKGYWSS